MRTLAFLVLVVWAVGCGPGRTPPVADAAPEPQSLAIDNAPYGDRGSIPERHLCGPPLVPGGPGENVSPAVSWSGRPEGTLSYALVMRDRDAGGLVHWVLYDIAPTERAVPEGIPPERLVESLPPAKQAEIGGSSYFGYLGPCSGGADHEYLLTLHAVGEVLTLSPDASDETVARAIERASLSAATLSGRY